MVSEVNGPRTSAVTGLDQRGTKIGETRATDAATATRGQGAEVVTLTDLAARLQALTRSPTCRWRIRRKSNSFANPSPMAATKSIRRR